MPGHCRRGGLAEVALARLPYRTYGCARLRHLRLRLRLRDIAQPFDDLRKVDVTVRGAAAVPTMTLAAAGYPRQVEAVTVEAVRAAWQRRIRPEQLVTVIAGGDGDRSATTSTDAAPVAAGASAQ